MKKKPSWLVYRYDINQNKIVEYNIFNHIGFREYIKKAAKKSKTKTEFEDKLKQELRYYFWSKSEHELIIELTEDSRIFLIPWCGCKNPEETKIEIFPIVTEDDPFYWIDFTKLHIGRQIYENKAKVDIYDQVEFVWDHFVEYCWSNKKQL